MFKVKLLTSRVTLESSHVPGDVIEVGNDEAWSMIEAQLGVLVGKNKPEMPARLVAAEAEKQALAEAAAQQATNTDSLDSDKALADALELIAKHEAEILELRTELGSLGAEAQALIDENAALLAGAGAGDPVVNGAGSQD